MKIYKVGKYFSHHSIWSEVDYVDSEIFREDGEESVEEPRGGDSAEEDKPEVEEDIDLLIDDVDRQNAQRVVGLDGAGGSVLVEPTLESK